MNEALPKVSVVCAWYNRADYIRDTIDSLLAQDYPNFDITVVNDGSPDPRVREILESYADPRLRVIHQANTGFTIAIRRAIDESNGAYIAIQGAGDVSLPGRLKQQSDALGADSALGICGCMVSHVVVDDSGFGEEVLGTLATTAPDVRSLTGKVNPFSHGEVMFSRDLYQRVGGYRPFFTFAQDRDLWLRMLACSRGLILNEHLYQRRNFLRDGVSSSFDKRLLQSRLSSFAIQCHHMRVRGEPDPVEKYGFLAAFFRQPSPFVADFFASHALQELLFGSPERAQRLIDVVLQEKRTFRAWVAILATLVSRLYLARPLIRMALRPFLKRSGKFLT